MNWLLNRLREASTWRGLVWLLTVSGVALRPDQVEAIVLAGMAIAGLLGVFLQDKARDPNKRTRATDIPEKLDVPEIDLVGRSESTIKEGDSPFISEYDPRHDVLPDIRMLNDSLQSNHEPRDPGSTLRQDGSGWNG